MQKEGSGGEKLVQLNELSYQGKMHLLRNGVARVLSMDLSPTGDRLTHVLERVGGYRLRWALEMEPPVEGVPAQRRVKAPIGIVPKVTLKGLGHKIWSSAPAAAGGKLLESLNC